MANEPEIGGLDIIIFIVAFLLLPITIVVVIGWCVYQVVTAKRASLPDRSE